ncbi:RHS repeat domain-containing protein [Pseudomonas baetica]|uniref:RHS repeat domain-containing protein n=1 Tax=Pseudomonas baetica TaxID=674054 RepID=UPI002406CBA0|nr:RHS repeat-associated core domain-containing protein [Pseudomonas baetica]MDF9776897.1 insecticidal toxin complex protein TccC [Pseudomonas baetica]
MIRDVGYCRSVAGGDVQARITRRVYNHAGQRVADWDPRLAKQAEIEPAIKPNLITHYSLSDGELLTENVDAGWRLALLNDASTTCLSWDSRATQRYVQYDRLLRPIAVTEQEAMSVPKTVERFTFADSHSQSAAQNSCGRLTRHDDTAGTRHIAEYDLNGQVLEETRRFLKQLHTPSWPFELPLRDELLNEERFNSGSRYAPTGELLEQVDAKGNRHRRRHNLVGQTRQIHLKLANSPEQDVLSEVRYNADGQVQSETAGNGVISNAEFHPEDGRLLRLVSQTPTDPVLQDLTYDYDPVGNIVRIEEAALTTRHFKNQQTRPESTYCYDSFYQLIKATGRESCLPSEGPDLPHYQPLPPDPTQMANYVQTFEYDTGGNLEKLVHVGAQQYCRQMITAPDSNRSLPLPDDGSEPDFANRFDPNGNLKCLQAGPDMNWNLRNQLQEITLVSRADNTNDRERYIYDGGGQRVRKITSTQAKNVSHVAEVLYLPGLEIRTDSARNEVLHVINVQAGRGSVRVLHWETPPPKEVDNDQLRYGLCDHLGSSSLELDEQARVLNREGYYPLGGTAWFAARSEVEGKYKTIRYSGKERDVSGLYYYGFRYYVAWWGRWLSPDPARELDGLNLFRMVGNNPLSYVDPNGLIKTPFGPPPVPGRPASLMPSTVPPVPSRPIGPSGVFEITEPSVRPVPALASNPPEVPADLPPPDKAIEIGSSSLSLEKIKEISSSFETWLTRTNTADWLVLKDYSSMLALDAHGLAMQRIGASNEVFAYRFSERLNLNIVPATIIHPEENRHILSRYVHSTTMNARFDRRESSMYVFDFLLNTRDRIDDGRHGNILFDPMGKAFAIDHDQILEPGFSAINPSQITDEHLAYFMGEASTKERIIATDWGAFFDAHAFQDPLINRAQAKAEFLGRVNFVRQRLMAA